MKSLQDWQRGCERSLVGVHTFKNIGSKKVRVEGGKQTVFLYECSACKEPAPERHSAFLREQEAVVKKLRDRQPLGMADARREVVEEEPYNDLVQHDLLLGETA